MTETIQLVEQFVRFGYAFAAPAVLSVYLMAQCGGKKKSKSESCNSTTGGGGGGSASAAMSTQNKDEDKEKPPAPGGGADAKPTGPAPKAPTDQAAVAGTHDPNYQTLAGIDGNVFQEKGGAKPAGGAPAAGGGAPAGNAPKPGGPGMAATHDPNYQTLAGLGNDCFDKKDGGGDKKDGAAPAAPKPGGPGMAATHDPNYQTLAGLGNDCFQKK